MKPTRIITLGLLLIVPGAIPSDDQEPAVRTAIRAFYKAFDDGFVGPADFATEDWNHINPYGGRPTCILIPSTASTTWFPTCRSSSSPLAAMKGKRWFAKISAASGSRPLPC